MIYELTRAIAERMGRPSTGAVQSLSGSIEAPSTAVFFEDERPMPDRPTANVVRVSRDEGGDTFDDARTAGAGQAASWVQWAGVRVLIHGVSNQDGATAVAHQRACNEVVDAFLTELQVVAHSKKNPIKAVRGKWLKDPDAQREHGARYELTFQLGRAVLRKPFGVAASPLVAGNVTKVDNGTTTETSCG